MVQILNFFIFEGDHYIVTTLQFKENQQIPFPIGLPLTLRLIIAAILLVTLTIGIALRKQIINYLNFYSAKQKPVNFLIWIEHCTEMLSCAIITHGIFVLIYPYPPRKVFGEKFCHWFQLIPVVVLTGSVVWSCLLALYRIIYIKFETFVKFGIGEKRMLLLFVFIGFTLQAGSSYSLFISDEENLTVKICNHYSTEDIQIMKMYKVKTIKQMLGCPPPYMLMPSLHALCWIAPQTCFTFCNSPPTS